MTDNRIPALILLLATIAFGVAPFITPPFTGYEPGMFPVRIERPAIQPAGYAFSIWSVIYVWLILHAAYGLWRRANDPAWGRVRLPLTVALVLGTVWLAIAGTSPIWATVTIVIMAAAAVLAFLRAPTEPDRWLLSAPLAIFAGWLTAASAVSTGVVLAGYGVLGNTESAIGMMGAVLILAPLIQFRRPRMPVYGLTVVWALIGIAVVNWGDLAPVSWVALGIAGLVLVATSLLWRRAAGQIP
ncbi:hypothetical protein [Tabrizicola sp.]|uniref:hypothetical protein n=1 Tax=Tabrizicola sp. TaxID=2005166 RepID=UPI003F31F3DB